MVQAIQEIRTATLDDLPAIVRLMATEEIAGHLEDEESFDRYLAAFEAIESEPHNRIVVGVVDGDVISTLQLTFISTLSLRGGLRAQIEGFLVDPAARGQGYGGALLEWAVEEARQRGCVLVQLTARTQRTRSVRFYERHGFERTHHGLKRTLS